MPKHEMISDGQDEPITSMPTKADSEEKKKEEKMSDPVMDAPSC